MDSVYSLYPNFFIKSSRRVNKNNMEIEGKKAKDRRFRQEFFATFFKQKEEPEIQEINGYIISQAKNDVGQIFYKVHSLGDWESIMEKKKAFEASENDELEAGD